MQQHVEVKLQDIPQEIKERHSEVTLAIDVMYINKIPFLMTTSLNINFGTGELVKDIKNKTLMTSIELVIQAYQSWGIWWKKYMQSVN